MLENSKQITSKEYFSRKVAAMINPSIEFASKSIKRRFSVISFEIVSSCFFKQEIPKRVKIVNLING